MTPKVRHEKLRGRICRTCLKPGGICIKGKKCSTKVTKGLVCEGCIQYVQGRNLSPHNILYCTSNRPAHAHPPKSKFYRIMQEYFGGKVTGDITPESICYGVFLSCKGVSEPSCSEAGFAETPTTAHLTQWVMIGSEPHLVMYDQGSNFNLIRSTVAENQQLQRISTRAERIAVAGGGQV